MGKPEDEIDAIKAKLLAPSKFGDVEEYFAMWWQRDGQFLDPDMADVPGFYRHKGLAAAAFAAGVAVSSNYVADDPSEPIQITFANGRIVTLGDDGTLKVNTR